MGRITVTLELRGQKVDVECALLTPDESVGLMGYGFEDETIKDQDDNVLDWTLTPDEEQKIADRVAQRACDDDPWDYDQPGW